jgi:hypothetical protein
MLLLNTNTINRATTQYYGHDINSLSKFDGSYFASSETGLYKYTGNVDLTSVISAYFITATMDFGIDHDKRLRYVYLSLEATGNLELSVKTEKVAAIIYPVVVDNTIGQQDIRIPISRSLHGRFWTFKISNGSNGADFSIDEIKILPIMKNRSY